MKCNLWMIANRLYELEPELHIPDGALVNLRSARRAYADCCVYVYQRDADVICDAGLEGGYIIFHEAACDQIFEMVQFAFDFFEDWFEEMMNCVEKLDYRRAINKSWAVVHNPILLLDAGNHLLVRSEQYGIDEVNEDWKYLCEHGCSAISVIQYLMECGKNKGYYTNEKSRIYSFPPGACVGTEISVAIYNQEINLGRMNIIQKDRKLNAGDLYLADYLVKFLSQILIGLDETRMNNRVLYPVLNKMLMGQAVSPSEINYWKNYTCWKFSDELQVIVLKTKQENPDIQRMILICNLIQNAIPFCIATETEKNIVFVGRLEKMTEHVYKVMDELILRFQLVMGISNPFQGIEALQYYYDQAKSAIKIGLRRKPEDKIFSFQDYAPEYILSEMSLEKYFYAIHPDIRKLWGEGEEKGRSQIQTLQAYLENERSLLQASKALYLHRNTLVYRLRRVMEKMNSNLEDSQTRYYLMLSIRVLKLWEEK